MDRIQLLLYMEIHFVMLEQACADAKYYGNMDIYNILKSRGAKVPVRSLFFLLYGRQSDNHEKHIMFILM